jgi:transcriptional regulator with XRE-family HTH domain
MMDSRRAFGKALRQVRKARGLTQEDFSTVSSRTYLSALERGLKSPTLDKIEVLCEVMEVHPLTLLALTYLNEQKSKRLEAVLQRIEKEVTEIQKEES